MYMQKLEVNKKQNVRSWTRINWLRMSLMANSCEQGNEPLRSIRDGEFLTNSKTVLSKNTYASWC
jgi:hypothetical protein